MHRAMLMYLFSFETKANHQLADCGLPQHFFLEHSGSPLILSLRNRTNMKSFSTNLLSVFRIHQFTLDMFQLLECPIYSTKTPQMPFVSVNNFAECHNSLAVLVIGRLKASRGKQVWIHQNENMAATKGHFLSRPKNNWQYLMATPQ